MSVFSVRTAEAKEQYRQREAQNGNADVDIHILLLLPVQDGHLHADDLRCKRKLLLGNVKLLSHHAHSLRRAFACNQFAQQARRSDARERAPRQFQPGCRAHRPKRRNLYSAFAAAFFLQRIARNGRTFICGNGPLPAEAHLCAGAPKAAVLFQNNGYRIRTGSAAGFRRDDLFHGEKQPELVCNVRKNAGWFV